MCGGSPKAGSRSLPLPPPPLPLCVTVSHTELTRREAGDWGGGVGGGATQQPSAPRFARAKPRGTAVPTIASGSEALEGKGPQRRLDRRLEEVAKAVGAVTVGYKCHWPWQLASGGQWLRAGWALEGGGGVSPPSDASPASGDGRWDWGGVVWALPCTAPCSACLPLFRCQVLHV